MTGKFRKKPVVIEAKQFDGNVLDVQEWCRVQELDPTRVFFLPVDEADRTDDPDIVAEVWDKLHSTWVGVKLGQWIIHGIQGEFYPCDADVFEATYEEVDGD